MKTCYCIIILAASLFCGCSSGIIPFRNEPAKLGDRTTVYNSLKSLPPVKEKIVAAVYKFRDQTGQYKPTANGGSFSTAVTQGATSILIRALDESGWFIPIEREGLSSLLNERQIIRSSRINFQKEEDEKQILPPLLYAGIILEGGIISYDSNIKTGGIGIKYFGLGGSEEYREDKVTIYLRAISTQSGRILKNVYTTKTVLSQQVDVGLYRFVDFKRLLESEAGYSYNEPIEMCVTEAIEKAVESLIIEGVFDRLWELKNPADIENPEIKRYIREKQDNIASDYTGKLFERHNVLGIGLSMGGQQFVGDFARTGAELTGEVKLLYNVSNTFSLSSSAGGGRLSWNKSSRHTSYYFDGQLVLNLMPLNRINPYLSAGASLISDEDKILRNRNTKRELYPAVVYGLGAQISMGKSVSLDVSGNSHLLFSDAFDNRSHGRLNDYYWGFRLGIIIYP